MPDQPGQLLVYSNDGAARSSDGGAHWALIKGLDSAIYNMTTSGPRALSMLQVTRVSWHRRTAEKALNWCMRMLAIVP
ncbi:hypothetical protein [Dictyobacter vulcani]|uniref:hypothetical protein n=1 Tax=Dictyobacter vulcani TaxID=2607529 RepID=UPI00124FBDAF|nr:hypothetical protein [Dictyobacter vulcani]